MKCHTCQKTLVGDRHAPNHARNWLHCPDQHVLNVALNANGDIVQYMLFWDDVERQSRYRLESYSDSNQTYMEQRPLKQREMPPGYVPNSIDPMKRRWSSVMSFPNFLSLTVKDDVIVVDNLINRLMKLRAFA